jgi:hypothetical protein
MVALDLFTKAIEIRAVRDANEETYARFLMEEIVTRHGAPVSITTDRGKIYTAKVVNMFYEVMKTARHLITSYRPQGNAPVERVIGTMKSTLKKFVTALGVANWHEYLPFIRMAYHNTTHSVTGYTPFFLMHGREMRLPIDVLLNRTRESYPKGIREYRDHLRNVLTQAYKEACASMTAQQRMQLKVGEYRVFTPGDYVYLRYDRPMRDVGVGASLSTVPWVGPYQVKRQIEGSPVYVLDVEGRENVVHSERLMIWTSMQKFFTKQGLRPQSLPARAAIHVPKPKFIDEDEGKEYEVEEIIDQRVVHKHSKTKPVSMEYKVRWEGYQEVDDTWEPEENLAHCQGKLKKFYASERRAVI